MQPKWFLALAFFWLLGMADTVYLTYHHYQVNILMPAEKSFCVINQTIDCDKAATATGATLMGIPVATWGMFAFTFIMMFAIVERLLYWEVQKALYGFLFLIIYLMAAFSLYEAFISFAILRVVCIMCAALYVIMILMLISCKGALGVSHREFFLLLRDLFFRAFSRNLLRKGVSVTIIALVCAGIIAFGIDHRFQRHFSYQRVDRLFSDQASGEHK